MKTIIEKIQKLLALSESPNQHEAEAAAQKAQELLSKYNLSIDAIALESNGSDAIDKERYEFKGSMKKWREQLMKEIMNSLDCYCVWHYSGNVINAVSVYGLEQNVQIVIYLYKYLEKTVDKLRKTFIKQCNIDNKDLAGVSLTLNQRYHYEKSYTLGIVKSIRFKLLQQKGATPATPGALVPVIGALISKKMDDDFDALKKKQSRVITINNMAFNQGREDGSNITISKGVCNNGDNVQLAIVN